MSDERSGGSALLDALESLRGAADDLRFPLEAPGARSARRVAVELVQQLDDYLLPRVRRLDAPLLAVVGGSTGAGKSLLVSSLVRRLVTAAGVLRPTTRSPVLVHHPAEAGWFGRERVLPGLARSTSPSTDPGTLQVVACDAVPPGLALLDAPDIDSVVVANRELAAQLLAAADLWLFVTTAARYADAVPWDLLREARGRATSVVVVLDRVAPGALDEVRAHLAAMLADEGLADAPLLTVPEVPELTADGLLPESAVGSVRALLDRLAQDAQARAEVVRHTLAGALASLAPRTEVLRAASGEQAAVAGRLRGDVETAYAGAVREVDEAMTDGSLLRGEVLARWQEFVGTGELLRGLESRIGRLRDRVVAAVRGRPAPGAELAVAVESGVEALVLARADAAAERVVRAWGESTAGASLVGEASATLSVASSDLAERTRLAVRQWQGDVLDLVRGEGAGRRSTARVVSYGVNGTALVVMLAVFAHTGGLTGAEGGIAIGASAVGQKVLEAMLGDQAVRSLAGQARTALRERVAELLAGEQVRFMDRLVGVTPDPAVVARLDRAAAALRRALHGAGEAG